MPTKGDSPVGKGCGGTGLDPERRGATSAAGCPGCSECPPENQREVGKFRKKPVEVEAVQWTGENRKAIEAFLRDGESLDWFLPDGAHETLGIRHGEVGHAPVALGDYVMRDDDGKPYSTTTAAFEATYEPIPPAPDPDENQREVEVSEEAVELAAKARFERKQAGPPEHRVTWDEVTDGVKDLWRKGVAIDLQAAAPVLCAQERERIEAEREEERCEECEDTGIYHEGDEWAPCSKCEIGREFAECLKTSRREAAEEERERLGFTCDDAIRLGGIADELEHLPPEIRRTLDQDGRDARFLRLKQQQILDSVTGTPLGSIRQQAAQQERERVKEALLSKESLTAIFGGEYGEEEVEPLREILTTLDKETD